MRTCSEESSSVSVSSKDEQGKTYVVDFPDSLSWEQYGKPFFKDKAACPDPAQRVVRGDARHGLLRAVQIIQPLGRHIRAQKTLGRLLGELFEIKPQAEARKALVRLDRSR